MRGGKAAYTHALLWVFTDKEAHAQKPAEILNAWSATLECVTNHEAKLLVGMFSTRTGGPSCMQACLCLNRPRWKSPAWPIQESI